MFGDRAALRLQIRRFNGILKEEASAVGARYIDVWPRMLENASQLAADGLHPSAEAYDDWASELGKQIKLK